MQAQRNEQYRPDRGVAPSTQGLRWQQLVHLNDTELATLDIAAVNLCCARGLPDAQHLDVELCLRTFDAWAQQVADYTTRLLPRFHSTPQAFEDSQAYFRVLCLVTVLQRDLGVAYNPAKTDPDAPFDTADCFVHGLVQGNGGTCATLPVVYTAVGRRLGYPLKLVCAKGPNCLHVFARWDEPNGERFNIEATNQGLNCPPDDYYRTGLYATTPAQERKGLFLQSMTPKQELASFLNERGQRWRDLNRYREAVEALSWAWALVPQNIFHRDTLARAMNEWGAQLGNQQPPGFPPVSLTFRSRRRFPPSLPWDWEQDILYLQAWENCLSNPVFEQQWWGPMRRREKLPQHPHRVMVIYKADGCCEIGLHLVSSQYSKHS